MEVDFVGAGLLFKRRDRMFIVDEILMASSKGLAKTQIMYQTNLSYKTLNEYLTFMLKTGLINKNRGKCKTKYFTTEKGVRVLNLCRQLTKLLR